MTVQTWPSKFVISVRSLILRPHKASSMKQSAHLKLRVSCQTTPLLRARAVVDMERAGFAVQLCPRPTVKQGSPCPLKVERERPRAMVSPCISSDERKAAIETETRYRQLLSTVNVTWPSFLFGIVGAQLGSQGIWVRSWPCRRLRASFESVEMHPARDDVNLPETYYSS